MEKDMYEEALDLLKDLEHNSERQKACNCSISTIVFLRDEIYSLQKGDYEIHSQYPGEHYFVDCFFPKTKEDKKLEQIFLKIYKNAREKKLAQKREL